MSRTCPPPHPYLHGDIYVPALLSQINNRLTSGASQLYLRHFGIGINEWRILSVLSNTPGSNAAHICVTIDMHKAVASRSVRDMQAKGLLRIDRSGTTQRMTLTDAGQAMHDRIAAIALERERRLLGGLDDADVEQLRALLLRLRGNVPAVNAWDPMTEPAWDGTDIASDKLDTQR